MSQKPSGKTRRRYHGDRRYLRSNGVYIARVPVYDDDGDGTNRIGYELVGVFRPAAKWEQPDEKIYDRDGEHVPVKRIA